MGERPRPRRVGTVTQGDGGVRGASRFDLIFELGREELSPRETAHHHCVRSAAGSGVRCLTSFNTVSAPSASCLASSSSPYVKEGRLQTMHAHPTLSAIKTLARGLHPNANRSRVGTRLFP